VTLVDLDDLKRHLGDSSFDDDDELAGFLAAAEGMVRDWAPYAGPVTETVTVHRRQALLSRFPVVGVTAVNTLSPFDYLPTSVDPVAYPLINAASGIVRAAHPDGTLLAVTYNAGGTSDAQYRLAVLEVAAYLWRGRKGGSETYLPAGEPDVQSPLLGGIKRRVMLILGGQSGIGTVA
jgi:hypothetical protein